MNDVIEISETGCTTTIPPVSDAKEIFEIGHAVTEEMRGNQIQM